MSEPTKRPKNWLLIKIREWHTVLGVVLAVFIVLVCASGIYLNHKDFFRFGAKEERHEKTNDGLMLTAATANALPMSFDQAISIARERLGDVPLEKIELKDEHGSLMYKVKTYDEAEVMIAVATGAVTEKSSYKKEGAYDVGKIIKDLHTGKIGGEAGKLFVDFTSVVVIILTVSGVYLWAVPKYRKRKAQREAAARIAQNQLAAQPAV